MDMEIINCRIENCGTGISAPADMKLDIRGTSIANCGRAIELRDPPSLLAALGLQPNTPPADLREVLQFVGAGFSDPPAVKSKAESAGLVKWLAAGSDFTTVVGGIVGLAQSGYVQAALALLPK